MIGQEKERLPLPVAKADLFSDPVLRKVGWRLIPFLALLYIFNIIDRANVGFARLTMLGDLGMKDAVFNVGFGLFYFGYLLFEVPSNLLLRRVGARRWIARIMISWGLVSCATAFVSGAWSFCFVRILLGVAEAGFLPGVILYLTYWFTARERARVTALFMAAIAISGALSYPVSGAILEYLDGLGGWKGWQWLFLLEGAPSVFLGLTVFTCLADRPEEAQWLAPEERSYLVERLSGEERDTGERHVTNLWRAFVEGRVWLLIAIYYTVAVGSNAAGAYFPQFIQDQFNDLGKFRIGLLGAIPHLCAAVGMIWFSAHSDRSGERRGHLALAAFLAASGWAVSAAAGSPWLVLAGLCLSQTGMMCMLPVFWAIPASFLSGVAAAGGIALINSVANLGGLMGPSILGWFGQWAMVGILFTGGALAFCIRK